MKIKSKLFMLSLVGLLSISTFCEFSQDAYAADQASNIDDSTTTLKLDNRSLFFNKYNLSESKFFENPAYPSLSWGAPLGNGGQWGKFENPGYKSPGPGPDHHKKTKHKKGTKKH
ncbi:hypothetical protein [Lactobacillus xujianguonis]|uniref:hypothetical protein n=1 Tax=Lactobacillus xujianguonis TaxID=2495899 RepID=UPI000FDA3B74|nr:hypothetical protein [Lactobacillus xujianguonis]RVU73675.1 hypothetical protein EJK20_06810 [Lactobacillus xujianguonis]